MRAVMRGDIPAVKRLLGQGADVSAVDPHGETPLIYAVSTENPDLLDLRLPAGQVPLSWRAVRAPDILSQSGLPVSESLG